MKKRPKIVKIAAGFNRTTGSVLGKEFFCFKVCLIKYLSLRWVKSNKKKLTRLQWCKLIAYNSAFFLNTKLPCKCVNSLFVFFLLLYLLLFFIIITLFILCNFYFFSVCVLLAIKKKKKNWPFFSRPPANEIWSTARTPRS